jgi:hypothetical protein
MHENVNAKTRKSSVLQLSKLFETLVSQASSCLPVEARNVLLEKIDTKEDMHMKSSRREIIGAPSTDKP